jgi:ribosomal-protein-alanine N-acetyltransferase
LKEGPQMRFTFKPMNESYAHAIVNWHYEGIYAFYDMGQDLEDLAELLNPDNWPGRYYAVTDERKGLLGFFCFEQEDAAIIIGLGLGPEFTGSGLGQGFVAAGLEYARQKFGSATFCLSVATFNQRAIRVYKKVGFRPDGTFIQEANGGQYEFLRMVI